MDLSAFVERSEFPHCLIYSERLFANKKPKFNDKICRICYKIPRG